MGKFVLVGPITGIGHFHLGPLYYYLLLPFYFFSRSDPMASNYLNIAINSFNFLVIYIIFTKLLGRKSGFLSLFIYAVSNYLIRQNQIPWNVSLVPGISVLIFYCLYKVCLSNFQWFLALAALCGLFFNIHFTAIFLPLIVLPSLLLIPNKSKSLRWFLISIPLYLVWLVPVIFADFFSYHSEFYKLRDFLNDYFIGFHFRFLLFRIPDSLILLETIIFIPLIKYIFKYILPPLFLIVILFFEKDKKVKLQGKLVLFWLIGPLIGFTLYGGQISDYYFLITLPSVLFIIVYLQKKLLGLYPKNIIAVISIFFWIFYLYINTKDFWIKPKYGGLAAQKAEVKADMRQEKWQYKEGDIKSYLFTTWKDQLK